MVKIVLKLWQNAYALCWLKDGAGAGADVGCVVSFTTLARHYEIYWICACSFFSTFFANFFFVSLKMCSNKVYRDYVRFLYRMKKRKWEGSVKKVH